MTTKEVEERWRVEISHLKRLTDDFDWFKEVYEAAFCKVAQKDKVLRHVSNTFDTEVLERLTCSFPSDADFNILCVGVGEGLHEFHFAKALSPHFQRINIYALDPSHSMLEKFRERLESDDVTKMAISHWLPITLAQFLTTHDASTKFHLVSAIHSINFTPDLRAAVEGLLTMITKDGFLLCELGSDDHIFRRMKIHKPWLQLPSSPHSPIDIVRISEEGGNDVTVRRLSLVYDVTDLFDESSTFGNKLLDFFTMTSHFRRLASPELVSDVIEFWQRWTTEDDDERKVACGNEDFVIIRRK